MNIIPSPFDLSFSLVQTGGEFLTTSCKWTCSVSPIWLLRLDWLLCSGLLTLRMQWTWPGMGREMRKGTGMQMGVGRCGGMGSEGILLCQYYLVQSDNGREWKLCFLEQLMAIKRNKVSDKVSQWTVISYYLLLSTVSIVQRLLKYMLKSLASMCWIWNTHVELSSSPYLENLWVQIGLKPITAIHAMGLWHLWNFLVCYKHTMRCYGIYGIWGFL